MKVTTSEPGKLPESVRKYLEGKGLKPSWNWDEIWQEEHAAAFTVAKAMGLDVLKTLRDAVTVAIAEGQSFDEFRRRLPDVLAALGWWGFQDQINPKTGETERVELGTPRRLKVIYVTNGRVARAVGQWQRIQRTKKTRPFLIYELGPSQNHRPEHAAWAGSIRPVDDPIWGTLMPPNGWGCKCRVRQLSKQEAADLGGETTGPELEYVDAVDPQTGDTVSVPRGVDPEWAYNPGASERQA